jgi:hypothetical protein
VAIDTWSQSCCDDASGKDRSEEILDNLKAYHRQRQDQPASNQPDTVQLVNGNARIARPARRYETPTFHPRSMFARTLRSGEIALLERRQRLAVSAS